MRWVKLGSGPHDSLSHLEISSNISKSVFLVLSKPGVSTRTMLVNVGSSHLVTMTSLVYEVSACPTPTSFPVTLPINWIVLNSVLYKAE